MLLVNLLRSSRKLVLHGVSKGLSTGASKISTSLFAACRVNGREIGINRVVCVCVCVVCMHVLQTHKAWFSLAINIIKRTLLCYALCGTLSILHKLHTLFNMRTLGLTILTIVITLSPVALHITLAIVELLSTFWTLCPQVSVS